jgi:hypothetical protein
VNKSSEIIYRRQKMETETKEVANFHLEGLIISLFNSKYQMKEVCSFIFCDRTHTILQQHCI